MTLAVPEAALSGIFLGIDPLAAGVPGPATARHAVGREARSGLGDDPPRDESLGPLDRQHTSRTGNLGGNDL